jgi:hypothetical protein
MIWWLHRRRDLDIEALLRAGMGACTGEYAELERESTEARSRRASFDVTYTLQLQP